MSQPSTAIDMARIRFPRDIQEHHSFRGDDTLVVRREKVVELLEYLRDEPELAFTMLVDVTCVDHLGRREPRFEVVYHLLSLQHGIRLRVKAPVPEDDPRLPSAAGLFRAADWGEREAAEFFGITFEGHPDPRKLLLYDEFDGFPLRKDYPKTKRHPLVEYRADACTEIRGRDCR